MKSAYGRKVPAPDDLTIVEPGSPMGELLRCYTAGSAVRGQAAQAQ
jgi:hypothetical protein